MHNLFFHYSMLTDMVPNQDITFEKQLEYLQSSYIWNIYKHLTQELLEKTAQIPFL